jgi:pimeloyl-ACP methyl ester carboxylesterase
MRSSDVWLPTLVACAAPRAPVGRVCCKLPAVGTCALRHLDVGSRFDTALPAVVVVHGLLGSGGNFQSWASRLSHDCAAKGKPRRVLLVDLRNHGDSDHAPTMSFQEMAADVLRLFDELGIRRAVLCGHSLGGKVRRPPDRRAPSEAAGTKAQCAAGPACPCHAATPHCRFSFPVPWTPLPTPAVAASLPQVAMALALLHPSRVDRLLVLDIAPAAYTPDDGSGWGDNVRVIQALRRLNVDGLRKKAEADAMLARHVPDAGLRAFVLMNLVRRSAGGMAWRVNLDGIADSLEALAGWEVAGGLPRYEGNTLFVTGGKSRCGQRGGWHGQAAIRRSNVGWRAGGRVARPAEAGHAGAGSSFDPLHQHKHQFLSPPPQPFQVCALLPPSGHSGALPALLHL